MVRPAKITEEMVEAARKAVSLATTIRELRTGLRVAIPKAFGVSNAKTAQVLGVGLAAVMRMQKEIRDQVAGRQRENGAAAGASFSPSRRRGDFLSRGSKKRKQAGFWWFPRCCG